MNEEVSRDTTGEADGNNNNNNNNNNNKGNKKIIINMKKLN